MKTETKIQKLQAKIQKLTDKLKTEIEDITRELDYHNGSRFSYNVDRLERFNRELQEFQIINPSTK